MLVLLAFLVCAHCAPSFYINGPVQGVFGSALSFSVSSFPLQCSVLPSVRVEGPARQTVPFSVVPCANGVTLVTFLPCAPGAHTVAVLGEAGQQIAALTTVIQSAPTTINYVDGPAIQTIFDFGDLTTKR